MVRVQNKGRSLSSACSMASALQRDLQSDPERTVRPGAFASGLIVRKTRKDIELSGSSASKERFDSHLAR